MLSNWRVGQVLSALVVDTRPNNGVLLSVGGKQFVATTDLPVQPGTNLSLEVRQLGKEVVLRNLPPQEVAGQRADASGRAAETAIALSSAKPSALLSQLAAQPARFGSPAMQEAVRGLLGKALKGESMTPGDLRKAVRESGLFTEADVMASRTEQAARSVKTQASQLQMIALAMADEADEASAEHRVLSQIAEKAGGLLNGIANNQLASLSGEDQPDRWVMTLPVKLAEQFRDVRMQIERDKNRSGDEESEVWRANLSVDLPKLGAVDIRVQMARGAVSVNFVCDETISSRVLNGAMPSLEQRLIARELNVNRLVAEAQPSTASPISPPRSMLDVEA